MHKLDQTDLTILRILQSNAKKTAKDISNKLNLTVSPVYERIRRLERNGYIKKYVALLEKSHLNLPVTAICHVSMRYHEESFIDKFESQIQNLTEVQECLHTAGKVDFVLKINIESMQAYHDFVRYKLSKIENIRELNSLFVLKEIKNTSEFPIPNTISN